MSYDFNAGDGANSEWNEAMFKMRRLDDCQNMINITKMNPFGWNEATGQWNYEIWFNAVCSLYSEGEAKYKEKEKEEIKKLKELIEKSLELYPVFEFTTCETSEGVKRNKTVFKENWIKIKKLIELMESQVRLYNDKHGLSTKNAEDYSGRSILR